MSEPTQIVERGNRGKPTKQKLYWWLPFALIGIFILLAVGLVVYGTQPAGRIGPRLQLDREQVDLGDQHFNTVARASFKITNAGDTPLSLTVPKTATALEGC